MAQRDNGLISESPCEGRQKAGAPSGVGRWNDAAWVAVVLAFFAIQYRATVFLGRALVFQPPAQINFFHVSKKVGIKTSGFSENTSPDEQTGPRSPKNIRLLLVLPVVLFNHIHYPATAEWVAILIDVSARCTGMFKF